MLFPHVKDSNEMAGAIHSFLVAKYSESRFECCGAWLIPLDQTSYGCFRQVPYEDIEAYPADYYDVSRYKAFIKNPLHPDVGIMTLASMALTLDSGDFNFYDPDTIQANILSHTRTILQQAEGSEGREGSAYESNTSGDGNGEGIGEDLTGSSDGMKLSGAVAEEEQEGNGDFERSHGEITPIIESEDED
jgi:hypothetical protein